ncbi:hypothetical protein ACT17_05100 [Mycolicibacterium conceptionense]|jgi:hypothetical protein|uniref:Transmembrane protein n=3 Tax=Mycolicibacterium TaxID=1866885 RepID=A0A0J8UES3_9MYCO|nr:hypothetical protein AA982_15910 [Mycolicibacterium senegalense]KMV19452.1 hypothetical protein ACT17_05100 [Mycolicibacterium conceptionense]OBH95913.1 hypothetical protein A5716_20075 [Mycolicibacterium conceptionense]OMB68527.1 hypothetical protein A5741_09470 [Mycolicibacterium conceptionense]OMB93403.1 hypothetical protein A5746_18915 [Mycolicibacterium conceptionense]
MPGMRLPDSLEGMATDPAATSRVFGEPYVTPDGATVIPVSRVSHRPGNSRPLGIFVVKDGEPTWVPAVDHTRIALLGELIGLVAATLATAAMLRRPPWPDVRGDFSRRP